MENRGRERGRGLKGTEAKEEEGPCHMGAYMDKDLSHRHMTNSGNWILTVKTYLHNGCKDRDYFLHFNKIETNLKNGYKDKDQNAYSLFYFIKILNAFPQTVVVD